MEVSARKVEIFEPFGAAYEAMKRILFRPFDIGKWFIIGFAAFLSGAWGGGFGFNPVGKSFNTYARSATGNTGNVTHQFPSWFWPAMIGLFAIGAVIALGLMWIVSRGRFVFTDCVVRNRGAIVAPWREFRREGNSYFLFTVALGVLVFIIAIAVFAAVALPLGIYSGMTGLHRQIAAGFGPGIIFLLVLLSLIWIAACIYFGLILNFIVPVMYRRRCTATEAFADLSRLVLRRPGVFLLYALFCVVLWMALAIIGTIVACATCCIGALPYVSTVLLLPAFVWLRAFTLYFLRQFGPEYDVWANLAPAEPPPLRPPLSPEPPPLPT